MNGVLFEGRSKNVSSVDTTFIKNEVNTLTSKETEIQNKIDEHISEYLDCIRRKI